MAFKECPITLKVKLKKKVPGAVSDSGYVRACDFLSETIVILDWQDQQTGDTYPISKDVIERVEAIMDRYGEKYEV